MSIDSPSLTGPDAPEPSKAFLNKPIELKILPNRRIKVIEKVTGKKEYYPQKKKLGTWEDCLALTTWGYPFFKTRKGALKFLEKEYNKEDKSVYYEYFN